MTLTVFIWAWDFVYNDRTNVSDPMVSERERERYDTTSGAMWKRDL